MCSFIMLISQTISILQKLHAWFVMRCNILINPPNWVFAVDNSLSTVLSKQNFTKRSCIFAFRVRREGLRGKNKTSPKRSHRLVFRFMREGTWTNVSCVFPFQQNTVGRSKTSDFAEPFCKNKTVPQRSSVFTFRVRQEGPWVKCHGSTSPLVRILARTKSYQTKTCP